MSTPTKNELAKSYEKVMDGMRTELTSFERFVSYLFHSQLISSLFSLLSKTLFNARALLIGSTASFIALVFFYLYAKLEGYTSTGLEPLIAFLGGWLVGLIIDVFSRR